MNFRNWNWISGCLLGLPLIACSEVSTEDGANDDQAQVAEEAEEAEEAARMASAKLAEVTVGDGTVTFYEFEPGDIDIVRKFPMGAVMPSVPNESKLSLAALYSAYAPGQPIPQRLLDASARVEAMEAAAHANGLDGNSAETKDAEIFRGQAAVTTNGNIATVQQGLSSSTGWKWFQENYCTYQNADVLNCWASADAGDWASAVSHSARGAICGDTGSGKMKMYVHGDYELTVSVAYDQCGWATHHHGHNWWGGSETATIKFKVTSAADSVRFSSMWTSDCWIL